VKNASNVEDRSRRKAPFSPNEVSRRIGLNVRRLRKTKDRPPDFKLTQAQMGKELWGVSASRMNQIEKGKENLSLELLIDIAVYFRVDIYELFLRPGLTVIDRDKEK
jgi:DNA-binding XRE family transcriptional regulator